MQFDRYPDMMDFFYGYLNQDYELCGETFRDVVQHYKDINARGRHFELAREIDAFMADHPEDLDMVFEREIKPQVDHTYWGYTTTTFLQELKYLLQS